MAGIKIRNSEGYKTEIYTKGHLYYADEPVENEGKDEGSDPYELLLSALGSCKAITMRMYAQRKDYPLNDIEIDLSHHRNHAVDCQDCETKEGKIDIINVRIKFTGDLNNDQILSLLEISEKCPVHRTLMSEIIIKTNKRPEV